MLACDVNVFVNECVGVCGVRVFADNEESCLKKFALHLIIMRCAITGKATPETSDR